MWCVLIFWTLLVIRPCITKNESFFHSGRLLPSKWHRRVPSHGSAFCLSPWEKIIPLCWSSRSVNMSFLWIYQLTSTRNVWAQLPNSCIGLANNSARTSNSFFIHLIHLYPFTYSLHVAEDGYSCTANSHQQWNIFMSASYSSSSYFCCSTVKRFCYCLYLLCEVCSQI